MLASQGFTMGTGCPLLGLGTCLKTLRFFGELSKVLIYFPVPLEYSSEEVVVRKETARWRMSPVTVTDDLLHHDHRVSQDSPGKRNQ